jgi:hypothetical protein
VEWVCFFGNNRDRKVLGKMFLCLFAFFVNISHAQTGASISVVGAAKIDAIPLGATGTSSLTVQVAASLTTGANVTWTRISDPVINGNRGAQFQLSELNVHQYQH